MARKASTGCSMDLSLPPSTFRWPLGAGTASVVILHWSRRVFQEEVCYHVEDGAAFRLQTIGRILKSCRAARALPRRPAHPEEQFAGSHPSRDVFYASALSARSPAGYYRQGSYCG